MDILISCNDRYGMPTMVMLTSLLSSYSGDSGSYHCVHMLESELSDEMNEKISTLVSGYGWDYKRIHVRDDLFERAKTLSYISRETYFRLLAPQVLPESVERILWLDSDILVRGDISSLFGLDLGGSAVAACGYGPAMEQLIRNNAVRLGLAHPETYFNAGVMLMDLPACRNAVSEDNLARIATEKTGDFLFPGQDTVNLLFDGMIRLLDYRVYNCMTHCIVTPEDLAYARENALIVHFPGEAKPWRFDDIHFSDEWAEWYRRCFGEYAPLRRMSYFRLKALYERQKGN